MSEIKDRRPAATPAAKAFPGADDMAQWNRLSPADKRALIERDEEAGFQSGVAPAESAAERRVRVRAER